MIVAQCPERDSLYEYSVGRLSDDQYEEVSAHLEGCPDCQAELMTLEDDGDTLVGQLRTPVDEPYLKEPAFRAAVAQARAIPRRDRSDSFVPRMLGEYELLEETGRGGMGRVYKARHTKLNRLVAVKILPRDRVENSQTLARFEREMRAIGGLDHPHIVHAYDGREIDQVPVLVMEYVEGMDLAELVRRLGRLKPEDACELVRQAALGLQYAHENGLVHRDIKPSNIMLTRDGRVKLLDLGLARFYADPLGDEVTGAGQAMGTADYIAPEQVGDSRSADIRADIYSLGCTLYKLLSGRAPYSGHEYRGAHDKMSAHLHRPLPPITQHVSGLPAGLVAIVERMLAKDPAERFATPAEVVEALLPLADGADTARLIEEAEQAEPPVRGEFVSDGVVAGGAAHQPQQTTQPQRRKPWWQWVIALGLTLCMLGTGFAAGVIITIRKNGQETQIEVPDGAHASVSPAGDVDVTLGGDTVPVEQSAEATRRKALSDADDLEGVWQLERREGGSSEMSEREKTAFENGRFRTWQGGELELEGRYEIDPTSAPKAITAFSPGQEKQKGIYRIKDDHLWIVFSAGRERPTEFVSEPPPSPNNLLSLYTRINEPAPSAVTSDDGQASGDGSLDNNDGGSPPVTTRVFGVAGTGRRFVYVLDRSDSMNGSNAIAAVKREIIRSLQSLGPDQEFQIIFYNHRPSYFEPSGASFSALKADDSMKRRAEAFVRSVQAFGGTNQLDALKLALRLEPDVIFFVTDARIPRLNRRHLDEVRSRAGGSGTTIHTVELGVDKSTPEDTFLRTLAHENGGKYRYINVQTLEPVAPAEEE